MRPWAVNARRHEKSGMTRLRAFTDVEDPCDVTAVATTLRLRRAARGDAAAFAAVYERHHQSLYRYCRSILRHDEDAQDALQSTMAKAFAALQTERREIEMRPWLFRIAHNEAVSILRRRTPTCTLDEDLGDRALLEDRVFEREALRLLRADPAG